MDNLTQLKEKIMAHLQAEFANTNFFVADVKALPTHKIELFVDRIDTNISIDECVAISRQLENYLETNKLVGEKYTLEVSSPGLEQPFKVRQQYEKALNKKVEVLKTDGIKLIGTLTAFDDEKVMINTEKKIKKEIIEETVTINYQDIKAIKKHFIFKI
jgi:ribosome maturation factor RimP